MINLAIFASGGGSNALKIMEHFRKHTDIKVALIVTGNPEAGVITLAQSYDIPVQVVSKKTYKDEESMLLQLSVYPIDYIILAGFIWLIPPFLTREFPNRILNIHPSLLPKYGGKGMYGHFVHEAVYNAGEKESGCTIHLVNERYDEGKIIFQAVCPISPDMNAIDIAKAVLRLEHTYYPQVIENYIKRRGKI
jgi:phosphoribosylglycinamide formyltransferase-1